ncbi:hypothetical protein NPX13_g3888 [Xylaria arbuscula]|uniref:Amine oxidase domain-containing protein n=1 Tax=Xylaria arbuscula TaxID=114810 RepID=A0A9W8NH21_9PEZI|nr:hypothetical protein NPX13_g3888 [Xylaria arbuscula]
MLSAIFFGFLHCVSAKDSQGWGVIDINRGEWSEVIERDVCIVGGGASGVHAAVSLTDLNRTVVIVEQNNRLGGHTETYIDPGTKTPVDIGVVLFQPIPQVYDFFKKLNVPFLNTSAIKANTPGEPANTSLPALAYATLRKEVDFRGGMEVVRQTSSREEIAEAFQRMSDILSHYTYIEHGYDLPDPVPEDLYMLYGAFIEKHNLTAAFQTVYEISQGMGDLLHIPTMYVAKYFNTKDIVALTQGWLIHAHGNTSEIYSKAGDYISYDNILLESSVIASNRWKNSTMERGRAELLVSTRNEGLKLLSCSQVVLAISPQLSNLAGWDITAQEHDVFSKYTAANGYYTGLVRNIGLNQTISYSNEAAGMPFNIPVLPGMYRFAPIGVIDDVWSVKFGADIPTMTDDEVKSYIKREIQTIQRSQNATVTEPQWLTFKNHSPFHLRVTSQEIQHGFYKKLNALQGGLGGTMFYTGAALHTHHTSLLWRFNQEVLIPKMMGFW